MRRAIVEFVLQAERDRVGFHHQGRVSGPGGGVDCVGLVVLAERAAGLECPDREGYAARARSVEDLEGELESHAHRRVDDLLPGDPLLWSLDGNPHVGVFLGRIDGRGSRDLVGHAYRNRGRVVVHGLAASWASRIRSRWRHVDL